MSKIVAGRFHDVVHAEHALAELGGSGFAEEEFTSFYVAPPGQHDLYPIGGDAHTDEGAREAGSGAVTGAVVGGATGLAIGAAAAAVAGPAAAIASAGIGAYVGSLAGALGKTRAGDEDRATPEHPVERPGGPLVAVCVDRAGTEEIATAILEQNGASHVEVAEGDWRNGTWVDFDPRLPAEPAEKRDPQDPPRRAGEE
jgi:hypothetical protein